jgi:hypothetical protein
MDCDEPHLTSNEKMQPIQWTEQPTSAFAAAGSLWPSPSRMNGKRSGNSFLLGSSSLANHGG